MVGEATQYQPTFFLQARAVFIRRLQLARHSLGFDWHRLGLLRAKNSSASSKDGHVESAPLNFTAMLRGIRQLPGIFRLGLRSRSIVHAREWLQTMIYDYLGL